MYSTTRLYLFGLAGLFVCLLSQSCSKHDSPEEIERKRADSVTTATKQVKARMIDSVNNRYRLVNYSRLPITSAQVLDSVRKVFAKSESTMTNYRALTTINRKDLYFMRVGDTLVVPDTISADLMMYSAFPQYYPDADTIPKIVLISNKWQCYACYEYGKLVRFAAVNSGEEKKATFPGRYSVNWRDRKRISSLDSTWILPWTVNFHLYAGSAFHQFEMPGRPVSHSCVRQFMTDAEWLYRWVKTATIDTVKHKFIPWTGTPVIIIDIFDFNRKRGGPWLELPSSKPVIELPKNPMGIEEALIPYSQIPKEARGALPDKQRYLTADSVLRTRGHIREGVNLRESINFNKLRQEKRKRKEAAKKSAAKAD